MFIEQGIKPENKFWKYILGFLTFLLAYVIGQLPFTLAVLYKTISMGEGIPSDTNKLMTVLDSNLTLFLLLLTFVFAFLGIYVAVKFINKQKFIEIVTARKNIDWKRVFFSFTIWAIFSVVSIVILYYDSPQDFVINFNLIPFLILAVIAIVLIPIQTSTEEFVFRGYLMQGFGVLFLNKWAPLLITSILFGLMHIFNPEVDKLGYAILIYYIGTGLFLGVITLMDDGMELCLGFHAANNLIGALLVTTDWTVFQTNSILKDISDPDVGFDVIMPVIVIFPILIFIFAKKYNWVNWKEKLTGKIVPNYSIKEDYEIATKTEFVENKNQ